MASTDNPDVPGTGDTVTEAANHFARLLDDNLFIATDDEHANPDLQDLEQRVEGVEELPKKRNVKPPESEETKEEQPVEDDKSEEQEEPEESDEAKDAAENGTNAEETFSVKIGDKEEKVSKQEVIDGYLRRRDYSQKTAEVAETRKVVETEKVQAVAERQQYANGLRQLDAVLTHLRPAEPKWDELLEKDPTTYLIERDKWNTFNTQQAAVQAEIQRVNNLNAAQNEKALKAHEEKNATELLKAIPAWDAQEVREKEIPALRSHLKSQGFTDQDIKNGNDWRILHAFYEQMKYREVKAESKNLKPTKQTASIAPGSTNRAPSRQKANQAVDRARKTGHVEDVAELFKGIL